MIEDSNKKPQKVIDDWSKGMKTVLDKEARLIPEFDEVAEEMRERANEEPSPPAKPADR